MQLETKDLDGDVLNWVVAQAEGYRPVYTDGSLTPVFRKREPVIALSTLHYTDDWEQAGAIIKRERIGVQPFGTDGWCAQHYWNESYQSHAHTPVISIEGPTPLVAALRCYVVSKLGPRVDVPDTLVLRRAKPRSGLSF